MEVLNFILEIAETNPEIVKLEKFAKNEIIYDIGDKSDKFFCILEGKVKISTQPKTKEVTKAILTKNEIFGESGFSQDLAVEKAKSMTKSEIYVIKNSDLNNYFSKDQSSLLQFMTIIQDQKNSLDEKLLSLVHKNSKCRIVDFLLDLHNRRGERIGFEYIIRDFLTHQEIANITATSRQTVTTVLNDLRADNIISFDRKKLMIKDLEKLKEEGIEEGI